MGKWDEKKHPRVPRGSPPGGRWTAGRSVRNTDLQGDLYEQDSTTREDWLRTRDESYKKAHPPEPTNMPEAKIKAPTESEMRKGNTEKLKEESDYPGKGRAYYLTPPLKD